jgi:aldose 1-epimerase
MSQPDGRSPVTLRAGELEATFLPGKGMLGISLRHRGQQLLRCIDALDIAAARGSAAGIPLLHPWANRLSTADFTVAGREVALDPGSPLLHWDGNHLPIHGVPWSRLQWTAQALNAQSLRASLAWDRPALLAVFPFPHRLTLDVSIDPHGLQIDTQLEATDPVACVPVSFGFHPYFGIPGVPRAQWRITLPAMQSLVLDARSIPIGQRVPFAGLDRALETLTLDDGFALPSADWTMSISGGDRRIAVHALHGYPYAQVYAPIDPECIALEPMTAPTNALVSGDGLRLLAPSGSFEAAFRIEVD